MNSLHKMKEMGPRQVSLYIIIALFFITSIIFVNNNYSFYERPIAVIKTTLEKTTESKEINEIKDQLYTQNIIAQIKNGEERGENIQLTNEYSSSGAYDQEYQVGNELFISIDREKKSTLTGTIKDVKRDKYVLIVAWVFILTLLFVGKKQGLLSVISLAVNAILLSYALDIYLKTSNISLVLVCSISIILFTVLSLLLVNGFNEKTYAAIIATLLGTFVSLLITYLVMWLTSENGLRYEEMQFISRP